MQYVFVYGLGALCVWMFWQAKFWEDGPWWRRQFRKLGAGIVRAGKTWWRYIASEDLLPLTHQKNQEGVIVRVERLGAVSEAEIICGERYERCECVLPAHRDDEVHVCDEGCGGSWKYDEGGKFVVVTYPYGLPTGRPHVPSVKGGPVVYQLEDEQ